MSKNIVIQKDGKNTTFGNVTSIVTKSSSGNIIWVPEEETATSTITVRQNGHYTPSTSYGYSKVNVLVAGGGAAMVEVEEDGKIVTKRVNPGPATGEGASMVSKGSDGNLYYLRVDSEGKVIKKKVPSTARVLQRPRDTEYSEGATINYRGCRIGLYYGDGSVATDWDAGSILYGTANWDVHILPYSYPLTFPDGETQKVPIYVLPFWYERGLELGEEYGLRCELTVYKVGVSRLIDETGAFIVTSDGERIVVDEEG